MQIRWTKFVSVVALGGQFRMRPCFFVVKIPRTPWNDWPHRLNNGAYPQLLTSSCFRNDAFNWTPLICDYPITLKLVVTRKRQTPKINPAYQRLLHLNCDLCFVVTLSETGCCCRCYIRCYLYQYSGVSEQSTSSSFNINEIISPTSFCC